ncbi:hypothetical protein [Salinirubrum litoreum]|uniref:DUF7965 domain-containing protein n=1 Tax=Salinirubrum litoreum TaxID=1126234 RepID=A0ABD5REQ5_9EURY|nr:hypothetical protein [Salinirubrum litoreum]
MGEDASPPTGDPDRLLVVALATFHTVALVVLGVLGLVVGESVGDILAALSTELGFVLFLALWGVVTWTHRRLFRAVSLAETPLRGLIRPGLKWGGITGWSFFVVLFLVVTGESVVSALLGGGLSPLGDVVVVGGVLFGIGSVLSVLVGAVIGLVGAVVDRAVLLAVDRAVPA